MASPLYEPINVYKLLAPDIGIVDGPFEYLTAGGVRLPLPFTTRMTVIRLSNGELFLHSPIKFDRGLADELRKFGTVRHLVSPNQFHYAHIGEWQKAFPEAITPGPRLAYVRGPERDKSTSTLPETSTLPHRKSGAATSIRRCSLAAISRSSFSFICRRRH
jgi:hypothetical protein